MRKKKEINQEEIPKTNYEILTEKQDKKIKRAISGKVADISVDELSLIDKEFAKELKNNKKYSLEVDQDDLYNMDEKQKEFIKFYVQFHNIGLACQACRIDIEDGMAYYSAYGSQQEIRRINLAMHQRQFHSKMLSIDEIGGYLSSLISDDFVTESERLKPAEKLTATKMLIDVINLKKEGYENPAIIDAIDVEKDLQNLSVASIKQLIATSKDDTKLLEKDKIINDLGKGLSIEELAYLKSLPLKDLIEMQNNLNKGENK